MTGGRFRELMKKYGKVAVGVHLGVSAASITGLYVAIRNNVDVEAILEKFHMGAVSGEQNSEPNPSDDAAAPRNRTAQLAASAGGAFTLAILCNKALFPVRVPITVALTPPIARFLARRNIIKGSVYRKNVLLVPSRVVNIYDTAVPCSENLGILLLLEMIRVTGLLSGKSYFVFGTSLKAEQWLQAFGCVHSIDSVGAAAAKAR
ncbi:hypothetical protein VNO78_15138 [Psophocarpus tetragonolobus]|uniref:DUF1279 domain-containing protein n=1 Tax=Psophocarpus tetragonolobus TaxID=3891 RepID=A0AAN9SE27_PSOTE